MLIKERRWLLIGNSDDNMGFLQEYGGYYLLFGGAYYY
jgi:hypothetical protein